MRILYMEKRGLIERELEKCARAIPMERPTYTEFGARVGIPPRAPGSLFSIQSPTMLTRQGSLISRS
jgi:hypothetical protein